MEIWKFYTWENIDEKRWEWILIKRHDNWLQFAIFDESMNDFDGCMMINFNLFKNFSEIEKQKKYEKNLSIKSFEGNGFTKIMEDWLLVEIVGKMDDGILEDEWDLFFEEWEFRFYPILKDGTYESGYLPIQEENIVTIYYENLYLKDLEGLAKEKWTW